MQPTSPSSGWSQFSSWVIWPLIGTYASCKKVADLANDLFVEYGFRKKAAAIFGYRFGHKEEPLDFPLNQFRTNLITFEREQRTLAHFGNQPVELSESTASSKQATRSIRTLPPPKAADLPNAIGRRPPFDVAGKEAFTNFQIQCTAENFPALQVLRYMRTSICGLKEPDPSYYPRLIGEARQKGVSLWTLFLRDHRKQMSWVQWVHCGLYYCIYPLMIRIASAYLHRFTEKIRTLSKEKDPEKFNQILIRIANTFFKNYRVAHAAYVRTDPPTGKTLENYLDRALTEAGIKTLEELYFDASQSVAVHFSPEIPFPWLIKRPLNWIVNYGMKKWGLPLVSKAVVGAWLHATDRSNIFFSLALTNTFTEQLEKLEAIRKRGEGNGNSPAPLPGTDQLEDTIKKLTVALELYGCEESIGAIKYKLEKIEKRETDELLAKEQEKPLDQDAKIDKGMEGGILKAAHVFLHYLANPKNREDLLGQLFERINDPFTKALPKNEEAWQRKVDDYAKAQSRLYNTARRVLGDLTEEAVEAAAPGGTSPEVSKKLAEEAFQREKGHFQKVSHRLALLSKKMHLKAKREPLDEQNNLFPYLIAIAETLKELDNEQQLEKELSPLSSSDRDGIRNALPFKEMQEISERLLRLQKNQEEYLYHRQIDIDFAQITRELTQFSQEIKAPKEDTHPKDHLKAIEKAIANIGSLLPPEDSGNPTTSLKKQLEDIKDLFSSLSSHQKVLDAIYSLDPPKEIAAKEPGLLRQLIGDVAEFPYGFSRRKCLDQILGKIELITRDDKEKKLLSDLIDQLKFPIESKIWSALTKYLQEQQTKRLDQIAAHKKKLKELQEKFENYIEECSQEYNKKREKNLSNLQEESAALDQQIRKRKNEPPSSKVVSLQEKVAELEREPQIEIGKERLENHLSALGAVGATFPYAMTGLLGGGYAGGKAGYWLGGVAGVVLEGATALDLFFLRKFPGYTLTARVAASAFAGAYASQQANHTAENIAVISKRSQGFAFLQDALRSAKSSATGWGATSALVAAAASGGFQLLGTYSGFPLAGEIAAIVLPTAASIIAGSKLGSIIERARNKVVKSTSKEVAQQATEKLIRVHKLFRAPGTSEALTRLALQEFTHANAT